MDNEGGLLFWGEQSSTLLLEGGGGGGGGDIWVSSSGDVLNLGPLRWLLGPTRLVAEMFVTC